MESIQIWTVLCSIRFALTFWEQNSNSMMKIQFLLNPATSEVPLEPLAGEEEMLQPDRASGKKPGTPPKQIHEGAVITQAFGQERYRQQRSYSRELKIMGLKWWYNYRVLQGINESQPGTLRAPLLQEVASRYEVPITTLHNWRVNEEKIVTSRKAREKRLQINTHFATGQSWSKPAIKNIGREGIKAKRFKEVGCNVRHTIYIRCVTQEGKELCILFSDGWFNAFLSRYAITLRFATNKSQKIHDDYLAGSLSWMRFNRRNSQLRPGSIDVNRVVGRYLLDSIANLDENPLPFEFLVGQTYANKGSKSVQVKVSHSGWDKRQASLLLAVFGSWKARVRPLIIFKGKEEYEGRRSEYYERKREEERARYDW